jgi:ABC-type uncharacterized transport system permease subunit
MLQSEFLARQAKSFNRKLFMERIAHTLANLFIVIMLSVMFAALGVTQAVMDWSPAKLVIALAMLATLGGSIYFLFRFLDDLFFPAHSRMRITGPRR